MEKYYWYVTQSQYSKDGAWVMEDGISGRHPFLIPTEIINGVAYDCVLLNWKEISKEEFELFEAYSKTQDC